jgi:hypothetical protein
VHTIETPFGEPGFLVLAGSRLYGIDTPTSDHDYVGALIEPAWYRLGLKNYNPVGKHPQHGFEQHMFKGDGYEGSIYSLWKLAAMFAEGNPTILCLMFADPIRDDYGVCTPEFRRMTASRKSGHRFLKYMEAQRKSMIGQRAKHVTRTALIEEHGFDTKFGGHLIRLGYQGIEFLRTGNITLPMPEEQRQTVLAIRNGERTMDQVIRHSERLQTAMEYALSYTDLPDEADMDALSKWVTDRYMDQYE